MFKVENFCNNLYAFISNPNSGYKSLDDKASAVYLLYFLKTLPFTKFFTFEKDSEFESFLNSLESFKETMHKANFFQFDNFINDMFELVLVLSKFNNNLK